MYKTYCLDQLDNGICFSLENKFVDKQKIKADKNVLQHALT